MLWWEDRKRPVRGVITYHWSGGNPSGFSNMRLISDFFDEWLKSPLSQGKNKNRCRCNEGLTAESVAVQRVQKVGGFLTETGKNEWIFGDRRTCCSGRGFGFAERRWAQTVLKLCVFGEEGAWTAGTGVIIQGLCREITSEQLFVGLEGEKCDF